MLLRDRGLADRSVQGTEIAVDGWDDCRLFPRHNISNRVMRSYFFARQYSFNRHLDNDAGRRVSAISLRAYRSVRGSD